MKKDLVSQIIVFVLYLVNNMYQLFYDGKEMTDKKLLLSVGMGVVVLCIFLADYWINYRKRQEFKIPPTTYLFYNIISWIFRFKGAWLMIAINAAILGAYSLWQQRTTVPEED